MRGDLKACLHWAWPGEAHVLQGSLGLDKIFVHDFSMIFPWPSLLSILHLRHFAENIGKCGLSTQMLNFSMVAKKHTDFIQFRGKIDIIP